MATRRGDLAKESITKTLLEAFPGAFVADKKIYIFANDGDNEKVQIAVSLTMPKNPVEQAGKFADKDTTPPTFSVEMSEADQAKVQELMRKLNITPAC